MSDYEFMAPCHFGIESVLKNEILDLGLDIGEVSDGKVCFMGNEETFAQANIFLRTAERIIWKLGSFKATTFDELFEGVKSIEWEEILPPDAKFWVTKASSVKSTLFSTSDIQSIVKKAIVDRLRQKFGIAWFPESGNSYPLRVSILKDIVTIGIDTTGESLHKRGYRKLVGMAPLSETLASAMISLTPMNEDRILVDPFCGSGTIPIEAAMKALNMAPGAKRSFTCETWKERVPEKIFKKERERAEYGIKRNVKLDITGYDIDKEQVKIARQNAALAGLEGMINFVCAPVSSLKSDKEYGFIITNPPYGERLEEKEALPPLYKEIGEAFDRLPTWSKYVISSYEDAPKYIGRKPDKNRKIYNGMIKTYYYSFLGPKPQKKPEDR
ncbi:MAG: class I SAM-dependent RNA methyltransferase [Lachnospiraceae bacterium]|nr:class I SAM-dependent RNA methyltransferase [Lachnospiraceae bacterium]